jgi:hypothetical protein
VSIRNGRFVEVGRDARPRRCEGHQSRGLTVVPGLIESHTFRRPANRPGYHVAESNWLRTWPKCSPCSRRAGPTSHRANSSRDGCRHPRMWAEL